MNAATDGPFECPDSSSTTQLTHASKDSIPILTELQLNVDGQEKNNRLQSVNVSVGITVNEGEAVPTEQFLISQAVNLKSQVITQLLPEKLQSVVTLNNQGNELNKSFGVVEVQGRVAAPQPQHVASIVSKSRRRPRKINPIAQEAPGQVYTSYQPPYLELPPQQPIVDINPNSDKQENCVASLPCSTLAVSSCIPRYFDQKRKVLTLSPNDVSVKFQSENSKEPGIALPDQPYLVANVLALADKQTFSRVILCSDIQKARRSFGLIQIRTLVDEAFLIPEEPAIPADKYLLPKNCLIYRHPLLKFKKDSSDRRNFGFPVEVFQDGKRELKIRQGFIARGTENNIIISFDKEEEIKPYIKRAQANMDQFNHLNNYQLHIPETSNFGEESTRPCFSYGFSNSSTQVASVPMFHQEQPQLQQQAAVYFSTVEDCVVNNQTCVSSDTFYIYSYPDQRVQSHDQVPVSVVPTQQQQQQMPVIRAASVNNHNPTSFNNERNFILCDGGEIVAENTNMTTIVTTTPNPKKAKITKPRARAKALTQSKTLVQNLQATSPKNWRVSETTSGNPAILDIPSTANPDSSKTNLSTPAINHSAEKLLISLSANKKDPVIQTLASPSLNCSSVNQTCVLPNHSVIVTTANSANSLSEQTLHVLDKPEEKEEIRTDPRLIEGYLAMCQHCGIGSEDLHTCVRCKHRLPPKEHIVEDTWKPKTTKKVVIVPSKPSSTTVVSDVKVDIKTTEQIASNNKRSVTRKSKTETPTPAKKMKGGGRRGKAEECIVLSSDDEGPGESNSAATKEEQQNSSTPNNPSIASAVLTKTLQVNLTQLKMPYSMDGAPTTPIKSSGPKITLDQNPGGSTNIVPEITPEEVIEAIGNLTKSSAIKGAFMTVECRSIRVGDYKCVMPTSVQRNFKVVFSQKGILFHIPHAAQKKTQVACAVPSDKILNIAGHFRQRLPVVFISTGPKYAGWIRQRLGLGDTPSDNNYFCTLNGGRCQKYITFLAENFSEMDIVTMKQIYGSSLHELEYNKANELLMQITPDCKIPEDPNLHISPFSNESPGPIGKPSFTTNCLRSSTGCNTVIAAPVQKSQSGIPEVDCSGNKTIIMFQGVPVLQKDILCLADEQFLNDSIIDFWLRYAQTELLTAAERDRTYMFSTFFYKRLTTKNKKRTGTLDEDSKLSPAEKRHARVKRWTKDVDIFEKDFIIIPINENCHWFLAVICYPGLKGVHNIVTGEPLPDYKKRSKGKLKGKNAASYKLNQSNGDSNNGSGPRSHSSVPNLDLGEKMDNKLPEDSEEIKIKQPCILIFDSLAGEPRNRVYSTLREYLKIEHKTRKGEDRDYSKVSMPGGMPRVPQQPNHCDCGIFTLFYVQCFFRKPIASFEIPINFPTSWVISDFDGKREEIYNAVKALVAQMCPETLPLIPHLEFPPVQPTKAAMERKKQKEQIQAAPVEKVEKVSIVEEPMDVDVCTTSTHQQGQEMHVSGEKPTQGIRRLKSQELTPLKQTVAETARASPTDSDHDHDYAPIPSRDKTV